MPDISINGIRLHIHIAFLLLIALLFYLGNGKLALVSVLFSLLHEIAHGLVAKKLGYSPSSLSVGLFGGVLFLKEGYIKPGAELLIHSAGPFFNLVTALLSYSIMIITEWSWLFHIIAANLIIALFNLMPFYPLDGGKLMKIYLTRFLGLKRGYDISRVLSYIFSILLFLFGLYLVQYNIVNLIICALAVNLFVAGREDGRYSFNRLKAIYAELEEVNRI